MEHNKRAVCITYVKVMLKEMMGVIWNFRNVINKFIQRKVYHSDIVTTSEICHDFNIDIDICILNHLKFNEIYAIGQYLKFNLFISLKNYNKRNETNMEPYKMRHSYWFLSYGVLLRERLRCVDKGKIETYRKISPTDKSNLHH